MGTQQDTPSDITIGNGARLRAMASAVGGEIGLEFLKCVVVALRNAMAADVVFVTLGEGTPHDRARTILAMDDGAPDHFEYELEGTPCRLVYGGQTIIVPVNLADRFPKEEGYAGYVGVPIRGLNGTVIGHFAAMSVDPIVAPGAAEALMTIFAARVEADLKHQALLAERDTLITNLVKTNETLHNRSKALHDANKFKTQLMGMIAHDLRSPLASIVAVADLLDLRLQSPKFELTRAVTDVQKIITSAERLSGMISATLDRCRADSTRVEIKRRSTDMLALVKIALENNFEDAARKGIRIGLPDSVSVLAEVDEGLCLEAFDNLISNAIKYSPANTNVRIDIGKTANDVTFRITDEGQGLSDVDIARAFHPFQTLSAKPTAGESATGLGLANVRQVAEAHSGSIRVQSDGVGRGATFEFCVPHMVVQSDIPPELEGSVT